ncbi:agglutination protein [Legionella gratiana]|uniref:Agglutination protein n=1 Tax=Legionella gratiana TaxID=45066 RepID=A0A378J3S6_9GAMM|nr:TolC family outer membrane protein [Legionella gratiana]KTD14482.1 agglutination protein [Legionella gratiana]STX42046.1 agglutination protein [Legionella gratiana]
MKRILVAASVLVSASLMADTLNEAVQQALLSHPDVLLNTARSLTAQQGIAKARGSFYPTIDLAGGAGREQSINPTTSAIDDVPSNTLNRRESSVELKQNLFAGGAIVNEYKRNVYLTQAQKWKTQGVAEDMALDVVNRYLTVLMHEKLYQISVQNLNAHKPIFSMIQDRTKAGLAREAEIFQANGRMALAESNLISAQANLREAQINYAKVVGKWPHNLHYPKVPTRHDFPASLEKSIEIGLESHPTVKSSYADVKEAKAQYSVARSAYYPRVDLVLSASQNRNLDGLVGPNDDRLAMVRASYNIFRGGSDKARVRETAYQVQEAYEIKNRALIDLREALRLSWNAWTSASIRLKPLREHVDASKQTRAAYLEQFKLNKRTLLDLLDSQNELYEAEIAYERGKMEEVFARYRIINGMGKLLRYLHMELPVNVKNNDVFTSAQEHILLNGNMDKVPYPDVKDKPIGLDHPVPTFAEAKMTPAVINKNATPPQQVTPQVWYISCGVFKGKTFAQDLADRLRGLGFKADIVYRTDHLYAVLVGPYEYKSQAGNIMARLKEIAKVQGVLITYKNKSKYKNVPVRMVGSQMK